MSEPSMSEPSMSEPSMSDISDVPLINNILLIDNTIKNYQDIVDSVNSNTKVIVYSYSYTKEDLSNILMVFTTIERIGFIFFTNEDGTVQFLDYEPFFTPDMDNDNLMFIINLIKKYNVRNIDFLACSTLLYDNWKCFYNTLMTNTSVIVGASDDKTGNIKYGGDWILESISQDIEFVYFTKNIEYYQYLFDNIGNFGTGFKYGIIDICNNFSSVSSNLNSQYNGLPFSTGFYTYLNGSKYDLANLYNIVPTLISNPTVFTNMYTKYNGSTYDLTSFLNKPPSTSSSNIFTTSQTINFPSTITYNVIIVGGGASGGLGSLGASRAGGGGGGCVGTGTLTFTGGVNYVITIGAGSTPVSGQVKNTVKTTQTTSIIGGTINVSANGGGSGGQAGDGGSSGTGSGGTLTYSPLYTGAASNTKACGGGGAGGSVTGFDNPVAGIGKSYTVNGVNYTFGTGGTGGSLITGTANRGTGGGGGASGGSGIVILY